MTCLHKCCRRRDLVARLAFLVVSISTVAAVEVSPDDIGWRSSVEAALAGTTVSFLPGVYLGCNVVVPTGVTLAAKHTLPCPPGKFMENATSTTCRACATHTTSLPSTQRSVCFCDAGFSGDGTTRCEACTAGKFRRSAFSSNECTSCVAGKYANVSATTCTSCPAGKYQGATGFSSCQACGANATSLSTRGISVLAGSADASACYCFAGHFGDPTQGCEACPVANSSSLAGSTNVSACYCNPGYFGNGITSCKSCETGKYKLQGNLVSSTSITCSGSCPCKTSVGQALGTFSDGPGNTVANSKCKWLIAATADIAVRFPFFDLQNDYGDFDFVIINQCESADCVSPEEIAKLSRAGVSDSTIYISSTGFLQVILSTAPGAPWTTPGFVADWSVGEMAECAACTPGTYADASASSACESCPASTFQEMPGSSSCNVCVANCTSAAGSANASACYCSPGYIGDAAVSCAACTPGSYSPYALMSASRVYTILLDGGEYPDEVSIEIRNSMGTIVFSMQAMQASGDSGTVSLSEGEAYTIVPFDLYGDGWQGASAQVNYGQSTAGSITASEFTKANSIEGEGNEGEGKTFTVGTTLMRDVCAACPTGTFSDASAASACVLCDAGTYQNTTASTVCNVCIANTTSTAGSSGCLCKAGFSRCGISRFCEACAPGSYRTYAGMTACAPCAAGTFADASEASACVRCDAGTYQNTTSSTVCMVCAANTTSTAGSSGCLCKAGFSRCGITRFCEACAPGSYRTYAGMTTCAPCAAGTFADASEASACVLCDAGKYQNTTASTLCNVCIAN